MTDQELYNLVIRGLLKQGGPSVENDPGATCMYRGPNGCKCAAGQLIKDEFYAFSLEGLTSHHPRVEEALRHSGVEAYQLRLALQRLHDEASAQTVFGHPWKESLIKQLGRLADFGLNLKEPFDD